MAFLPLIFLALLRLSAAQTPGCGKSLPSNLTPGGASQNLTLESASQAGQNTTRRFLTYLPESFSAANDKATPLVLAFHGQLLPTRFMEAITGLSTPEFNKEYIVVYPEALAIQEPGLQWLGDVEAPPSSVVDDRVFVGEVLEYLTSTFCIDESRIYAAGLSNGGGMTGLVACDAALNKKFAAFAGVAAAFYPDAVLTESLFEAGCTPELAEGRKMPIMEMHGLNDSTVAYDGDNSPVANTIPIPEWIDAWREREGCAGETPTVEELDGGVVTRSNWTCGGVDEVFVHYTIEDFGHGWPSTTSQGEPFDSLRLGPTTFNATSVILEWFAKWSLGS